ncbi:hypothetical protein ACHMW5_27040 [Azospirillum melinis]|uniref:hypothetical protein n=1 Tax=Azospirillum melinis TaxID=328839 RepID=UPI0037567FCC
MIRLRHHLSIGFSNLPIQIAIGADVVKDKGPKHHGGDDECRHEGAKPNISMITASLHGFQILKIHQRDSEKTDKQ